MTAKKFLQQYLDVEHEINIKLDKIQGLREMATKTTTALGEDRVQSSAENKTERIVTKIVDLENEVDSEVDRLRHLQHEIDQVIEAVPNYNMRTILYARYLCGKKWEQIAVDMNYTYRNVCYIHGKALRIVAKKIS